MAVKLKATFLLLIEKFHKVKAFWIYKISDNFNIPGKEGNKEVTERILFWLLFSVTDTPLTFKDRPTHAHF